MTINWLMVFVAIATIILFFGIVIRKRSQYRIVDWVWTVLFLAIIVIIPLFSFHTINEESLKTDRNGDLYRLSTQFCGLYDSLVLEKFDSKGKLYWVKRYPMKPEFWEKQYLVIDKDNNVYILAGDRYTVLKYRPDGRLVWVRSIKESPKIPEVEDYIAQKAKSFMGAPEKRGEFLEPTPTKPGDGFQYVFGGIKGALVHQENQGRSDSFVAKYDLSGKELWARQYGTREGEIADDLAIGGDGNIYLSGTVNNPKLNPVERYFQKWKEDIMVAGFSPKGEKLWLKTLKLNINVMSSTKITCDRQGAIYVGAVRESGSSHGLVLVKMGRDGRIVWVRKEWMVDQSPLLFLLLVGNLGFWIYGRLRKRLVSKA